MAPWVVPALALGWAVATTVIGVGLHIWQQALEQRLTRKMEELARKARHDAVGECNSEVNKLWSNKVDAKLHEEQVSELKRRVGALEEGQKKS